MVTPVIKIDDHGNAGSYGYGMDISGQDGHTIIGHDGGMLGFTSSLLANMIDGVGVIVLANGPSNPEKIARYALHLMSAVIQKHELPPLPPPHDPFRVENPSDYVGTYRTAEDTLTFIAEGERLILLYNQDRIPLETIKEDNFVVNHPDFALFPLRFGRQGGVIVETFHGSDWYVNERSESGSTFEYPKEWERFTGHYRSYNPWASNFRIVLRKGTLVMIDQYSTENTLVPLDDRRFRVGEDQKSPECIYFDTIINGQAIHANLSGEDYYRFFTP
jgi:hypothetical protein